MRLARFHALLSAFVAAALLPAPALADPFSAEQRDAIVGIVREALLRDPSILRDAIDALKADDAAREQATAHAAIAAHRAELATPADPAGGNPSGTLTITEFFDVKCPYCRRFEPEMANLLRADHAVRLVYKDMPILGPASELGARALLAAQRQGKYEPLRDLLMRDGNTIDLAEINAQAARAGCDVAQLDHDLADPAIAARIAANLKLAQALGINGTPALVIGDELYSGAPTAEELAAAVARARAG